MAILFFQRVLHAGASAQTIAGLATGIPVFMIGIALGVPLSRWLTPMQLAIGAPLLGAVLAGVQYFDTHLWQAVVLSYIGAPVRRRLPHRDGAAAAAAAAPGRRPRRAARRPAVPVQPGQRRPRLHRRRHRRRHRQLPADLAVPGGHRPGPRRSSTAGSATRERRSTSPDMVKRLWEWAIVQAESMSETGIVTGLLAAPLLGVVTEEDADSAVVVDMARNILGNPYEEPRRTHRPLGRRVRDQEPVGRGTPSG